MRKRTRLQRQRFLLRLFCDSVLRLISGLLASDELSARRCLDIPKLEILYQGVRIMSIGLGFLVVAGRISGFGHL